MEILNHDRFFKRATTRNLFLRTVSFIENAINIKKHTKYSHCMFDIVSFSSIYHRNILLLMYDNVNLFNKYALPCILFVICISCQSLLDMYLNLYPYVNSYSRRDKIHSVYKQNTLDIKQYFVQHPHLGPGKLM